MVERIFLGSSKMLPMAVAERTISLKSESVPDLEKIIMVLPGKAAISSVQRALLDHCPQGILLPQLLTPRLLLHYQEDESLSDKIPSALAQQLIWNQVLWTAEQRADLHFTIFSGGKFSADKSSAGEQLFNLRRELAAGGFSIGDAAAALGDRGRELAQLEKMFAGELTANGYIDPLDFDRQAVENTAPFADVEKIIIAGIPDIPLMLRKKLENIDTAYPGLISVWISADEKDADDYDRWGVPLPERWEKKSLLLPLTALHTAIDPSDAARRAVVLAGKDGIFDPRECAVVPADQSLYSDFAREFSTLSFTDGSSVNVIDPGGVPFSSSRLYQLGMKLLAFLQNSDDFLDAAELLVNEDFLMFCARNDESQAAGLLKALDDFKQAALPDNFDHALIQAEQGGCGRMLCYALRRIGLWKKRFETMPLAAFLKKFFTAVFYRSDSEEILPSGVCFADECEIFAGKLDEFAAIPEKLLRHIGNLTQLEMFFRQCGNLRIPRRSADGEPLFEGRLEMPFLTQRKIIFCGMNEGFFPDRIDITPFLTDSIRKKIGIRSNIDTRVRSLCHLQSVIDMRQAGDVEIIVLRSSSDNSALRPSGLLFSGSELSDCKLLARCEKLFTDPVPLIFPAPGCEEKSFQLDFVPEYRMTADKKLKLRVTDLDTYLRGALHYFWESAGNMQETDYSCCEPDDPMSGTLCHAAFEKLPVGRIFPSADAVKAELFSNFDRTLKEHFGEPLPVMVKLFAANMKQRLVHGAQVLWEEQLAGFELLATEYQLGGDNGFIEYSGAVFSGKIDRIEYHPEEKILRIVDIKTGKADDVVKQHCTILEHGLDVKFNKLQLPAYAILLACDRAFKEKFPDIKPEKIECAYLVLPSEVTASKMQVWQADDLARVIPFAENEIRRIIAEILESGKKIIFDDPGKYKFPLLPDAAAVLPGINWQCRGDHAGENEADSANEKSRKSTPAAAQCSNKPFPQLPQLQSAGMTRCCDCPPEIQGTCACRNGDCASCKSFNGFKSFSLISASAGTGKTYALASRFIQLLEYGVEPEKIMAVTFTKKAAGEIFDRIIRRICALTEEKSAACCRWQTPRRAIDLLRRLLGNGGKELQISTIDSFFMRLLQVFAPDLGIWGRISMIGEYDDRFIRQVLRRWIRQLPDGDESDALRELLKESSSGGSKLIYGELLDMMKSFHSFYQQYLTRKSDGTFPQIDNAFRYNGKDLLSADDCRITAEFLRSAAVDFSAVDGVMERRLQALSELLGSSASGTVFGKISSDVTALLKLLNRNNDLWLESDQEELICNGRTKKKTAPELTEALRKAFRHIRSAALRQVRKKNIAVFSLIAEYDRLYQELVTKKGCVSFSDLPTLLVSRDPENSERVLGMSDHSLEMRLDCTFKHYMFDEFQDTSDVQGMVLDPLLREHFAQAGSGEFRSFFCVGDVKQSIYRWRAGNPELFNYIASCLRPIGESRQYETLDSLVKSYRSAQAILDTVNGVFCGYDGKNNDFPAAIKRMKYEPHISSEPEKYGYAALINVPPANSKQQNIPHKASLIYDIIRRIEPLRRGFSVGILVQKNAVGQEIAAALSLLDPELAVSVDGVISVVGSMAFTVCKELLILAEHPGDKAAQNFIGMLKFGDKKIAEKEIAAKLGLPGELPLAAAVRKTVALEGLAAFIKRFWDAFGKECSSSENRRLGILYRAADAFSGRTGDFIRHISNPKTGERGSSLQKTVQIMTMHQAKGLEFDIVFMPDCVSISGGGRDVSSPLKEDITYDSDTYYPALKDPSWVSFMPGDSVVDTDVELRCLHDRNEQGKLFEKMCNLYVGMTRAKHALFIMTSRKNYTDKPSVDQLLLDQLPLFGTAADDPDMEMSKLLTSRFGAAAKDQLLYAHGKWNWFEFEKALTAAGNEIKVDELPRVALAETAVRRASDEKQVTFFTAPRLRFAAANGKTVGTEVHGLFEKITFIDDTFDEKAFADLHNVSPAAAKIFCEAMALGSPVREVLKSPEGDCEVWCEKRFLLRNKNNETVPGAFDRVVICRRNGEVYRAEIIDYKSDNIKETGGFAIYFPQLRLYRESLAQLLGVSEEKISCKICALKLREVIDID